MSYEQLRSNFAARIADRLPAELLHDVLQALDVTSSDFEIRRICTDLIVTGAVPEVVRIYSAALAVENKSQGTIKGYFGILRAFFEYVRKPYPQITTNDIRVYLYHYQHDKHAAVSTVEHIRTVINSFFFWLVDEEYLERNPARKISPISVPASSREPLSPVRLEYLRRACLTLREKALIDFLYSTGCRVSEAAAMTINEIDFTDRSVRILHGKGDKFRVTYFNAEAEVSLREYLNSKPKQTEALFTSSRAPYLPLSTRSIQKDVRRICERSGIPANVTPHILRHTFATTAIGNGMPVQQVQQLLGHSKLDTTMIYAKVDQQDVRSSHRKYIA